MKGSLKSGFSFGLTSGIITTVGLIVGLNAGTHSKTAVVGGILTIAIADAFSDSLGMHMTKESENSYSSREIWEATASTLFFKFIFASTFIVPILMFSLSTAVLVSVVWGFLLLTAFSFYLAREQKKNPWRVIVEHLSIGVAVVLLTLFAGGLISLYL